MLRVRLVGQPSLELDGIALGWPAGRRAGELLAWLALNPGTHGRAGLAPRFWPDVLDESARASLRTALHDLRRALGAAGGAHLIANRDVVGLDDATWVNVRELRRAVDEGRDAEAVALADGELLQGIDAEWVHAAREEHAARLGGALARLSERAEAAGDRAEAARLARRRVALDPLAEEPVRALMRLLAAHGDRAAAIAAYEALRERMARDLRAAPSPVTRELAAELRGSAAGSPMTVPAPDGGRRSLGRRLAEEARRTFVGREPELAALRALIGAQRPATAVVFVSGPGGVGKSRFLQAALDVPGDDLRVVTLDCRDVEPTPAGFLAALCAGLGVAAHDPDPAFVADLIGTDRRRTVIALDTYETFGLMDAWLRRTFLPLLPERVLTIVAGRRPPGPAWLTSPGWQGLVRQIPLSALDDAEAERLLAVLGLSEVAARRANSFAHGHPLALELAAAAVRARPDVEFAEGPPADVIGQLVNAFMDGLEPDVVNAVRTASVLRRVDESLLRALLGPEAAGPAYEALRALPFCEPTAEGLVLHDVVRQAVARDLVQRDPRRAGELRRRAAAAIGRPAGSGPPLWQTTADLLYLVENPAVRDAFFPHGVSDHSVEPAGPGDADAIRRICDAWESPEAAAALRRWHALAPGAFSVARAEGGGVTGVSVALERDAVDPALVAEDPVVAAWARHLEAHPVAPGERVLFVRRTLTDAYGEALSAPMAALFLDAKRHYMALRPDLRRVYIVAMTADTAFLSPLGFVPAGDAVAMGDRAYQPLVLDFGPGSVDGWLAGLIVAEARAADPADASLTAG